MMISPAQVICQCNQFYSRDRAESTFALYLGNVYLRLSHLDPNTHTHSYTDISWQLITFYS